MDDLLRGRASRQASRAKWHKICCALIFFTVPRNPVPMQILDVSLCGRSISLNCPWVFGRIPTIISPFASGKMHLAMAQRARALLSQQKHTTSYSVASTEEKGQQGLHGKGAGCTAHSSPVLCHLPAAKAHATTRQLPAGASSDTEAMEGCSWGHRPRVTMLVPGATEIACAYRRLWNCDHFLGRLCITVFCLFVLATSSL